MTTFIAGCEPWSAGGGAHGVLVLHGFTGCPQSMRPLAEAFVAAGYTVDVPLLPGHGTTVEDMIETTWADWSSGADAAYKELAARCDRVVVAGLSLGGSISAWLATRNPEIAGVIAVNPPLRVPDELTELMQQMVEAGQEHIPGIGSDIADPDVSEVAYSVTPLRPLLSLAAAQEGLRAELPKVQAPLLLFTSRQDHVVQPADSDEMAAGVGGPVERIMLERSYHVATLDYDRDLITEESLAFAERVLG